MFFFTFTGSYISKWTKFAIIIITLNNNRSTGKSDHYTQSWKYKNKYGTFYNYLFF